MSETQKKVFVVAHAGHPGHDHLVAKNFSDIGVLVAQADPHVEAAVEIHEAVSDAAHVADVHAEALTEALHNGHGTEEHGATGHHFPRHLNHPPEPPHLIQILFENQAEHLEAEGHDPYWNPAEGGKPNALQVLHIGPLEKPLPIVQYAPWENHVYLALGVLVVIAIAWIAGRPFRRAKRDVMRNPTKIQIAAETITAGAFSFCEGILGEHNARRYFPYVSALFFLILTLNLMGLVPLLRAPSASIVITGSLALCTFFYYMYTAIVRLGPLTFLHHLLGSPQSVVQWLLSPLFLVLELVSYLFAKPASLALRLFGNILGKDILMGSFLFMGIALVSVIFEPLSHWIGLPLTYPFYFLGLLLSTIQALVFSLLSAIYILLVLPHDHDHEHHDVEHHPEKLQATT